MADRVIPKKTPVATLLLQKFYPRVQTLKNYLLSVVNTTSIDEDEDEESYRECVENTIVGSHEITHRHFTVQPVNFDMSEVVSQAQRRLIEGNPNSKNVLAMGYHPPGSTYPPSDRNRNTVILAFKTPRWNKLLVRIGVDAMFHLLTEVSIFLPLPNGCLCQATGDTILKQPVLFRNALASGQTPSSRSRKRKSLDAIDSRPYKRRRLVRPPKLEVTNTTVLKHSPADVLLARARLFYARPCVIPGTNHLLVGLPIDHVLNKIYPSYVNRTKGHEGGVEMSPRDQGHHVRHLSKYIFPGQYGLGTPFRSFSFKRGAYAYAEYQDRETEIAALGHCKTPKRLKEVLPLVDKLLWYHHKCAYKALRNRACPSKIPTEGGKRVDDSVILELVSEVSILMETQPSLRLNEVSVDSSGHPFTPLGLTQAKAHARNKPRFVEFACSHLEVFRYVALVTKAVIPMGFWGTKSNFHHILKVVKRFITCRRYESISVHYMLQGFSTADCDWLAPPGEKARAQQRVSVSDSLKRRELLEEFVFWYLDSFVMPLLKTAFYITDCAAFRNQILYFRQDDWKKLCEPLMDRLVDGMFERIPDNEVVPILKQNKLNFSFVRLLPKETGVRPIVNLRKTKTVTNGAFTGEKSINQILETAFRVLTYEKNIRVERMGVSVFGSDEVYAKLKAFKARLPKTKNGNFPRLYFVKLDVQACFDTIEQTKLLEILQELISNDAYLIQRYGDVHLSNGRVKKRFNKRAVPEGQNTHFLKTAETVADVLRNVIFADEVKYYPESKSKVLKLLEEHITENMVKIGGHYYKQKVGIPQGSILSALLCSFFYGDLEKRRMTKFTEDLESVLLRLIDDYLFVTTSLKKAKAFLEMMDKGHPDYGCFISKEKTLTNFDDDTQLVNVVDPASKNFPWCGYLINMKDLSISVDYSRYGSWGIANTLTVERGRRPGVAFEYKMRQFGQARNHVIYSDAELNSEDTVYLNVYQNFLLAAMKMQEYIREGGLTLSKNSAYVYKIIERTIESSHSSMMAQAARKSKRGPGLKGPWRLKKLAVFWLGNHAFHHVIRKRPSGYAGVLRQLEKQLGRLCNRVYKRRFRRLVLEGHAAFNYST